MRRSMAMRIFASLVAVWFGFITIQPLYSDPCPHHQLALALLGQGLGVHAATTDTPMSESMSGNMSSGGMHSMPGHDDSDSSHPCHCIGVCCGAAPVAIAQSGAEWVPATIAERTSLVASAPLAHAPAAASPHTLPFATAPPPALLA